MIGSGTFVLFDWEGLDGRWVSPRDDPQIGRWESRPEVPTRDLSLGLKCTGSKNGRHSEAQECTLNPTTMGGVSGRSSKLLPHVPSGTQVPDREMSTTKSHLTLGVSLEGAVDVPGNKKTTTGR